MIGWLLLTLACTSYGPSHSLPGDVLGQAAPREDERAEVELSCVYTREDKLRYYFIFEFPSDADAADWLQRAGFEAERPLTKPLPEWVKGPGNPVDIELETGCGWTPPKELIEQGFYGAKEVGRTFNVAAFSREGRVWGRGEMAFP